MRAFVTTRALGAVGAVGLVVVAVMLLLGELSLVEAARRAGLLLVAVLAVEHLVLPVARLLVGAPTATGSEPADTGDARAARQA